CRACAGGRLGAGRLLVEGGGWAAWASAPRAALRGPPRAAGRLPPGPLARLNAALRASPTAVAFVTDQVRAPAFAPAARALRHFATLRLQVTPLRPIAHPSGELLGLRVRAEVAKNKLAAAQRAVELDLRRARGVHREAGLVALGRGAGVLAEGPLGICFGRDLLGRGRARAIATLEDDPGLANAVADAIRRAWGA